MMGLFAYVYYSSLIRVHTMSVRECGTATLTHRLLPASDQVHHVNVGTVIHTIVSSLSAQEQLEVYHDLGRFLVGQGILPA